jgi:hypothetical protein
MLNPPVDSLSDDETKIVVEILRTTGDLGAANRELREQFPTWDLPRRLAGLRQAQNLIFKAWQTDPARKRRERLVQGHAGETHEEGQP